MIDNIKIEACDLTYDEIHPLLVRVDKEFDPPFFCKMDIEQYAHKLERFGHFIVSWVEGELAGMVVYYRNDEDRFIYIPLFVSIAKYARKGLGAKMLHRICEVNPTYSQIRVQVLKSNENAIRFYLREGFVINGEDGNRYNLSRL